MYLRHLNPPKAYFLWSEKLYLKKSFDDSFFLHNYMDFINSINDFIAPEFAKYGINTNQQDIPYISKRGGGIDHRVLKKIFSE